MRDRSTDTDSAPTTENLESYIDPVLGERLRRAVEAGEQLRLGPPPPPPEEVQARRLWQLDNVVPATLLRLLLLGSAPYDIHPRGVLLAGAYIQESLDLEHCELRYPLRLVDCILESPIRLGNARGLAIAVLGSDCDRLDGAGLILENSLDLSGSSMRGGLTLRGARIGELDCSGARMWTSDPLIPALDANRLRVDGDVILGGLVTGRTGGSVALEAADIKGELRFSGSSLGGCNTEGHSLQAELLHVAGDLLLNRARQDDGSTAPFRAAGGVSSRAVELWDK